MCSKASALTRAHTETSTLARVRGQTAVGGDSVNVIAGVLVLFDAPHHHKTRGVVRPRCPHLDMRGECFRLATVHYSITNPETTKAHSTDQSQ